MASGLRTRAPIDYALIDLEQHEVVGAEFELVQVSEDDDEIYQPRRTKSKRCRRPNHAVVALARKSSASSPKDDTTVVAAVVRATRSQESVSGSSGGRKRSVGAVAATATSPERPLRTRALASGSTTSPSGNLAGGDDDGSGQVCAFCGNFSAPRSFGVCCLEQFPMTTEVRLNQLRRGPHQAPYGSLSVDCKTADKGRIRVSGQQQARPSRRGNYILAHRQCASWAPGVFAESDAGKLVGVDVAVVRSLSQKCCVCGFHGASVACRVGQCRKTFHLHCAAMNACYLDLPTMTVSCPDHLDDVEALVGENGACRRCRTLDDCGAMVFCFCCGAHEHLGCTPEDRGVEYTHATWACSECQFCTKCKEKVVVDDLSVCVECTVCKEVVHFKCADPQVKKSAQDWRCEECRECVVCGSASAGTGPTARWHRSYTQCSACYQRTQRMRPCIVCEQMCQPIRDLKCTTCSKFVHRVCADNVPSNSSLFRCSSCCEQFGSLSPGSDTQSRRKNDNGDGNGEDDDMPAIPAIDLSTYVPEDSDTMSPPAKKPLEPVGEDMSEDQVLGAITKHLEGMPSDEMDEITVHSKSVEVRMRALKGRRRFLMLQAEIDRLISNALIEEADL